MLVSLIREGLGRIIAAMSVLTQGKAMVRTGEQQAEVNAACKDLSLYQFQSCPFCVKVPQFRSELAEKGGRIKVPCLRIEDNGNVQWMYESNDIIAYLEQRFG